MAYKISSRFDPHVRPLEFESLDDRACKGLLGFLGSGVPMLPEERREFERMEREGARRYVGISKVLEITD